MFISSMEKLPLRGVFLAYDHGLEHGPTDFNELNVSPKYIIDLANKAEVDALILLKGNFSILLINI